MVGMSVEKPVSRCVLRASLLTSVANQVAVTNQAACCMPAVLTRLPGDYL